ncbi:unnamed protein product [Schistosoma rodhaini]|uniref:Uncharacterized protein n=1 Tax=Schistosoma rodhaini TaxID=6188 RepID=A0A183QGX0_9TREM|nr:unnamed protein product [Schistosoma rodhaini]
MDIFIFIYLIILLNIVEIISQTVSNHSPTSIWLHNNTTNNSNDWITNNLSTLFQIINGTNQINHHGTYHTINNISSTSIMNLINRIKQDRNLW